MAWLESRPVPVDFGGPEDVAYTPFDPMESGIARFEAMAARFHGKVAVDDGTRALTYAQTRQAVHALAARLAALDRPGPVAALLHPTASFPVVFLAHLAVGRPLVPVDAGDPPDRQAAILRESRPACILLGEGVDAPAGLIDPLVPVLRLDEAPTAAPPPPVFRPTPDDPAGVAYTSGSTGRPKGLAFSQRQFLAAVANYIDACHINPDDRILSLASLSGAGCRDALVALLTGAAVRIVDIKAGGVGAMMRALHAERITLLAFVPSVLRQVMRLEGAAAAFGHLRILDLFGDRTTPADLALFREVLPPCCHIRLGLASTEATEVFHWFVRDEALGPGQPLPCGYLARGKAVALIDEDGGPAPPGEPGELVVRGRTMALGSWQDGALLPGPFLPDPADPLSRIFHTGDVVRLRPDGLAEFVGRRDRQIKLRGLRVNLAELEDALRLCPGIADVAAIVRAPGEAASLVAYAAASDPALPPDIAALRATIAAELPAHMMPAEIRFLPAIPRLATFKPDYVALGRIDAEACAAPAGPHAMAAWTEDTQGAAVRAAWARVFEGRPFDPDQALEDVGGDSLRVLKLVFEIERGLGGVVVPLDVISARMTARDLAATLRRMAGAPRTDAFDDRPVVFVAAGGTQGAARLAGLAGALSGWFRFEPAADPGDPGDPAGGIARHGGFGPASLVVHGAGASDARAVAAALAAQGRTAGLLLAVDPATPAGGLDWPGGADTVVLRAGDADLDQPGLDDLAARFIAAHARLQAGVA
jgi:acyl-coenzyme A synthetase/AMP-(fatty) acid ligase